jgi:hypothetical protein
MTKYQRDEMLTYKTRQQKRDIIEKMKKKCASSKDRDREQHSENEKPNQDGKSQRTFQD